MHFAESIGLVRLLQRLAWQQEPPPELLEDVRQAVHRDPATQPLVGAGYEPETALRGRIRWLLRTTQFCPVTQVEVAGHEVHARVGLLELWRFYLPLGQMAAGLAGENGRRALIGIAGSGASGKSVFARLLAAILNAASGRSRCAVCALDGFHRPNQWLESHYVEGAQGCLPLRQEKGSPATFDVGAFVGALERLRRGDAVSLPRYDRRIHDPVPDAVDVGEERDVVFVEGNYLLLAEDGWRQVGELLDRTLFLTVPPDALRRAMIERHVAGGRSPEDARAYYERVDRRNCELIEQTAGHADLLVKRSADQRIVGLGRP